MLQPAVPLGTLGKEQRRAHENATAASTVLIQMALLPCVLSAQGLGSGMYPLLDGMWAVYADIRLVLQVASGTGTALYKQRLHKAIRMLQHPDVDMRVLSGFGMWSTKHIAPPQVQSSPNMPAYLQY